MRITDLEVHEICPPYCDFNALQLSRYHGARLQRRTIYILRTDDGLEGLGESVGPAPDAAPLREQYMDTSRSTWPATT